MFNDDKTRHIINPQSKKMIGLMIMLMILLVFLPLVSSAPPFIDPEISSVSTLQVESPNLPISKVGEDKRFHAHVINATNSKTNLTTSCALHVYNQSGWDIITPTQWMEFETYNGIDFAMTINGSNFNSAGIYAYVIQCNSTNEVGFYRGQFAVTPNGEIASEGDAIFYVGLLGVFLFFFAISIYIFMEGNNLLSKVGSLGFGYLLLIAITFIGWNMSNDFLTSSPFIIEMLRLLFIILMIGAFPLLVGAFAYYIYMITKIKEIERLMSRGFDEHEARRRVR
jgi:flagellar basal body-associated protein FliL